MSARVQAADLRRLTYPSTVRYVAINTRETYRRLRAAGVDRWTARFSAREIVLCADMAAHAANLRAPLVK